MSADANTPPRDASTPATGGEDLALALRVADALDALTLPRFGALDLRVDSKPDHTPVSDADTAAERLAREIIGRERPEDSLLGEEFGGEEAREGRQWIIDPIDGTKNFVRGVPIWASLIGLAVDGVPRVGVVSAPALGRRWYAATGEGAWLATAPALVAADSADGRGEGPRRLRVSGVGNIADASIGYASVGGWRERGRLAQFLGLLDAAWRTRGYGDFYPYMLLAEGALEVACEPELALHDMAALVPIVREAGGRFTSLAGEEGPYGGSAVVTNGTLHAEVLRLLTPR